MAYIPPYIVEKLDALSVYDVAEKLGLTVSRNKALCFMHQDHDPSLYFKKAIILGNVMFVILVDIV